MSSHKPHVAIVTAGKRFFVPKHPYHDFYSPQSAMAGPAKKRAQAEKQSNGSSNGSSSQSRDPTQRSAPKSIPRLDGNRDPNVRAPVEYTDPRDLKNISDFLGMAGWYQARGVSTNTPLS